MNSKPVASLFPLLALGLAVLGSASVAKAVVISDVIRVDSILSSVSEIECASTSLRECTVVSSEFDDYTLTYVAPVGEEFDRVNLSFRVGVLNIAIVAPDLQGRAEAGFINQLRITTVDESGREAVLWSEPSGQVILNAENRRFAPDPFLFEQELTFDYPVPFIRVEHRWVAAQLLVGSRLTDSGAFFGTIAVDSHYVVPEPTTLALLALGLTALAARRRRLH